jgi:hypothetical protein
VAIAIGVRYGDPAPERPARVQYARIEGTRGEKLARLDAISSFANLKWRECFDGWTEPFLPHGVGDYFSWPLLADVFPWQHSGTQFKRTWPIAESEAVLQLRWSALVSSAPARRAGLFKESRDRKIDREYDALDRLGTKQRPVWDLDASTRCPPASRYAYRSFDRQWALADSRPPDLPSNQNVRLIVV